MKATHLIAAAAVGLALLLYSRRVIGDPIAGVRNDAAGPRLPAMPSMPRMPGMPSMTSGAAPNMPGPPAGMFAGMWG